MTTKAILRTGEWILVFLLLSLASIASAATLRLNPGTGVYTTGGVFTVSVLINTEGKAVNAADGVLTFNPRELQVSSVSRASSIFNLWTEEPSYSNSGGTVTFGGGSPTGYKGSAGNIMSVTFRALGAGNPKVNFKSGSALAADGMGTNVLTSMSGGTYTVSAPTENPEPEYISAPNTPAAPNVTSTTHPDKDGWYREKNARLAWTIPQGVTTIRTLLDESPSGIPSIVYDELITEKTIEDLDEGVSYFHIQFKNADGWGKIAHYRLAVDTEAPKGFTIREAEGDRPEKVLSFEFEDISTVTRYKIQIDGKDPIEYADERGTKTYTLPALAPGYHPISVEAFDSAGNSTIATYGLTIEAFEKPVFTDYPTSIGPDVIPAFKGTTRPNSRIMVEVRRAGEDAVLRGVSGAENDDPFTVTSDESGVFVFIPNHALSEGAYDITATAKDEYGRMSERSDAVRILVERPGYVRVGSFVVSLLSIIVPLLALLLLLSFGMWYLWHRLSRWVRKVRKETLEAEESLSIEFNTIIKNLNAKVRDLKRSGKGKLTKAEAELIAQIEGDLKEAQTKIAKEVGDIERIIK